MLRIRKINAEPDHTPSPARASLPRYAVAVAYLAGATAACLALLQHSSGTAEPWLVVAAAIAFATAVALNIYATARETRSLTAFIRFSATALLGAVAVEPLGGSQRAWSGIALVLLLLVQLIEPVIFAARRRNPIWSRNLPGARESRSPDSWADILVVVGLAPWAGAALSAFSDNSPAAWLTGAGLNLAVGAGMFLVVAWINITLPRRQAAFAAVLRDYDPEFVIYTARPDDASYQVSMWLPYLQRTGRRFIIVTRSDRAATALAELTDAPVVKLASQRSLEWLLTPAMGAAFYVNASSGNNALVRHSGIAHVYLGHGDSDKPPSYNPTHAMYDRVFAAGQGAIDRYAAHGVRIPRDKFRIVGRPQVSDITARNERGGLTADQATVLYAPTWRGHVGATAFQSLHLGEQLVRGLLDRGATVIFRPHPFSYEFPEDAAAIARVQALLSADAAQTGRAHRYGAAAEKDLSVIECMNLADAMISDVSSVVSDFLYSGKPFAMVAVSEPASSFVTTYPVAKGAYVIEADLGNYGEVLRDIFGADPLADARQLTRAYYLGDFDGEDYDSHFVSAVGDAIADGLAKRESRTGYRGGQDDSDDHSENASGDVDSEAALDSDAGPGAMGDMRPFYETLRLARTARRTPTVRSILRAIGPITAAALAIAFPHWIFPLAALVGIGIGMVGLSQRRRARGVTLRSLYGIEKPSWAVLTIALASVLGEKAAPPGFPTVLIALIPLLGAVFCIAGYFLQLRGVMASHLPGVRIDATEVPRYVVPAAGFGLLALIAALAAAIAPAFAAEVAPVVVWLAWIAVAANAVTLIGGAIRAWRSAIDDSQLHDIVAAYAPQFEVYFGGNAAGDYQFGMWAQYFDRIDRKYIVVARDPAVQFAPGRTNERSGGAPSHAARTRRHRRSQPVDGVLREQRHAQHAHGRTNPVDERLAEPRRLREARLLQPCPRHLQLHLQRRTGRRGTLRAAWRGYSSREVQDRRPPAGRGHPAADDSDTRCRTADRAVRADLDRPVQRHRRVLAAHR